MKYIILEKSLNRKFKIGQEFTIDRADDCIWLTETKGKVKSHPYHMTKEQAHEIGNRLLDISKGKMQDNIIKRFGVVPEKAHPNDLVCTIGYSKKFNKWYGWSHRGINGFKTREQAIKFAESVS